MACWYPAAETNYTSNTCTTAVKYKPEELIDQHMTYFNTCLNTNSDQVKENVRKELLKLFGHYLAYKHQIIWLKAFVRRFSIKHL